MNSTSRPTFKHLKRTALAAAIGLAAFTGVLAQDDLSGEITVLGFGLGDEIATVRHELFLEQNPNVTVTPVEGALDEQQFLTSVASGSPPDVVNMDRGNIGTYAARGALMPLTECIEEQGINMEDFRQSAVDQVTVNGEVYGLPQFNSVRVLMINTAAVEEAGLTVEDINTSDWEALNEVNEALTRVEDGTLTRIGFDPKIPEFLPLWVAANGGMMLSEDGRTAMLNSPEVVEALEQAVGMIEPAGGNAPFLDFRGTWDFFGENNQIVADQIGAWPMEDWYLGFLAGTSPDAPVAFAPFLDREGNPVTLVTGSAFAIPTGAPNADAACEYIATMTSAEAWIAAAQERARLRAESGRVNSGVYTGNRVADETIFGEIVQPTGRENFDAGIELLVSLQDAGVAVAANPAGAEFTQAWQDAVNRVLNGEQTAQEALDQAQEEAQAALDEGWSSVE